MAQTERQSNMAKLNPPQIGSLAECVKKSIDKFPGEEDIEPHTYPDEEKVTPDMGKWETYLKELIDASKILPNYEDFNSDETDVLDYLIEYYSSGEN